jgi:hypothetical protein
MKHLRLLLALFSASLLLVMLAIVPRSQAKRAAGSERHDDDEEKDENRIRIGLEISPVPLHFNDDDEGDLRPLVGLGSYLVNAVGNCNDCHTQPNFAPGGNPFLGQGKQINTKNFLAGGRAFVTPAGTFISRNLTPEAPDGLPAGLTFRQFNEVMRHGTDFDNLHPKFPLLQVMPWPNFQNMTDRDLRAIYEYLRAIPHADRAP